MTAQCVAVSVSRSILILLVVVRAFAYALRLCATDLQSCCRLQARLKKHQEGFKDTVEAQRKNRAASRRKKQAEQLKKWEGLTSARPDTPPQYNGEGRTHMNGVTAPEAVRAAGPGATVRPIERAHRERERAHESSAEMMGRVREHEHMLATAMDAIRGAGPASSGKPPPTDHDFEVTSGHSSVPGVQRDSSWHGAAGPRDGGGGRWVGGSHTPPPQHTYGSPAVFGGADVGWGHVQRADDRTDHNGDNDEGSGDGDVGGGSMYRTGEVVVSPSQFHGRKSVSSIDSLDDVPSPPSSRQDESSPPPPVSRGWSQAGTDESSAPGSPQKHITADEGRFWNGHAGEESPHTPQSRSRGKYSRRTTADDGGTSSHTPRSASPQDPGSAAFQRFGWSGTESRAPHQHVQPPRDAKPGGPRRPRANRNRAPEGAASPRGNVGPTSVTDSWAQPRAHADGAHAAWLGSTAAEPTVSVSSRDHHDRHSHREADGGYPERRVPQPSRKHPGDAPIGYSIQSGRTPTDNEIEVLWDAVRRGLQGHRGDDGPDPRPPSNRFKRNPRSREKGGDSRGSDGARARQVDSVLARARDAERNFTPKDTRWTVGPGAARRE